MHALTALMASIGPMLVRWLLPVDLICAACLHTNVPFVSELRTQIIVTASMSGIHFS